MYSINLEITIKAVNKHNPTTPALRHVINSNQGIFKHLSLNLVFVAEGSIQRKGHHVHITTWEATQGSGTPSQGRKGIGACICCLA